MSIPWQEIPKTPKDSLIDILVDIPTLLENLGKLCDSTSASDYRDIARKHHLLEHRLEKWLEQTDLCVTPASAGEDQWRTLSPEALAKAHLSLLYWTTRLLLQSIKVLLLTPTDGEPDVKLLCANILGLMPAFFSPQSGWFGRNVATLPLGIVMAAIQFLEKMGKPISDEKAAVLKYIQRQKAGEGLDFLGSMMERYPLGAT